MFDIQDLTGFKCVGEQQSKKQIILSHTSRNISDYVASLRHRNNGKYNKIPNFLINRNGIIFRLIPEKSYSGIFFEENLNKNSIIISLENLGWMNKIPLTENYVNWIGDIYKGEVVEKKWRDYFFWQPYTDEQMDSCVNLCKYLIKEFSINKKCIGHNTKLDGVERFNGIVFRSNFDSEYTDLSPAFNYEIFIKKIEDEQLV
jgi:hypothetical protein